MRRLFEGFLAHVVVEVSIFLIFAHLSIQEILIDAGQFTAENFVEHIDRLSIARHCSTNFSSISPCTVCGGELRALCAACETVSSLRSWAARHSPHLPYVGA